MPSEKSVSFRHHLVSNTLDLIKNAGWDCSKTSHLIVGIVSQLAIYTEEGVAMTPSVFLCNSITELVQLAGVGEHIPLSDNEPLDNAAHKILKATAPLCSVNWRIYIERLPHGIECKYGVFCGTSDPSSMTIDEVVFDDAIDIGPIIRISQTATNKVEVRTNKGESIEFRFNDDIDDSEIKTHEHIHQLSAVISQDIDESGSTFSEYIDRTLSAAIRNCHGTLIAVVPSRSSLTTIPVALKDCVLLKPPLNLTERLKTHINDGKTAESVSQLQTASELVAGFVNSDGITIFDTAGNVLGYRAFIQSNTGGKPVTGGARSRAFEAMKALVGTELTAAFFRSQDGKTNYLS